MCGIAGVCGPGAQQHLLSAMLGRQRHRGPDAQRTYADPAGELLLGHNRLSIIDLSDAGLQPMCSHDGRLWIVFNGEVYNYRELRAELDDYPYRSQTDTEVILAAYQRWGEGCLNRLIGMFALAIWDTQTRRLFAARDRFGVKPLYYTQRPDGTLVFASEIKALHAAGVPAHPDPAAWATYLAHGRYDHSERTFWRDIQALPPGHTLTWDIAGARTACWYDLAERIGAEYDTRPFALVEEEYLALLAESVRLRFRSDVPVGINLSGGLDSSTLLGLVQLVQGSESEVAAFTFVTGDPQYDELPWVQQMLARTRHPLVACRLEPARVPALAESVQVAQDEPFGGLPTLAYALLFEQARAQGVVVLLDGQGMDEQWAGYDYYRAALDGAVAQLVQGTQASPVQPACLLPEFAAQAERTEFAQPFPDRLRNLQYRDIRYTKIPRALRFNDRVSMRASTELREPFLDHRLFELALRQPPQRTIGDGMGKVFLRQATRRLLPADITEAPKRPLQTPQREWLRGPLRDWADAAIEAALEKYGGDWLDRAAVRSAWRGYCAGVGDNSFYIWQWVSLGLMMRKPAFRKLLFI